MICSLVVSALRGGRRHAVTLAVATCPEFMWLPTNSRCISSFVHSLWLVNKVSELPRSLFFQLTILIELVQKLPHASLCVCTWSKQSFLAIFPGTQDVAETLLGYFALSKMPAHVKIRWVFHSWWPLSGFHLLVSFLWIGVPPAASSYFIFTLWFSLQAEKQEFPRETRTPSCHVISLHVEVVVLLNKSELLTPQNAWGLWQLFPRDSGAKSPLCLGGRGTCQSDSLRRGISGPSWYCDI